MHRVAALSSRASAVTLSAPVMERPATGESDQSCERFPDLGARREVVFDARYRSALSGRLSFSE